MVPIRDLDDDYYEFDEKNYCLRGRREEQDIQPGRCHHHSRGTCQSGEEAIRLCAELRNRNKYCKNGLIVYSSVPLYWHACAKGLA